MVAADQGLSAALGRLTCEGQHAERAHRERANGIVLGGIHVVVRRAVHHDVGRLAGQRVADRVRVRDIHLTAPQPDDFVMAPEFQDDRAAEVAGRTGHEDSHGPP